MAPKLTLCGKALLPRGLRAWYEYTTVDAHDSARLRGVQSGGDYRDIRPDDRPVDRGQNEHRKGVPHETLLVFHILVACEKHVKALELDQRQKRAVFNTAPFHADDR